MGEAMNTITHGPTRPPGGAQALFKRQRTMKAELEIYDDRMYLAVDANITPAEENQLHRDGWDFLNNGITLADGTPALYFWKKL